MNAQPVVVVVGRPNVGKSTLFNRLTRSRRALVHDLPGVTRDRIIGEVERPGGGSITLVDTGGLLMEDEDTFVPLIRGQAEAAIRGADVVIFLLDGLAGPIPEDQEISEYLRGLGVPVVPVVKIASNSEMYENMKDDMDVNAGKLLQGVSMEKAGTELVDLLRKVVEG